MTMVMLALCSAGDHALISDCVYGPMRELDDAVLKRMNIDITYFAAGEDLDELVRPNTKLLYVESPGSLLFEMLDMGAMAAVAQRHGLVLVTDNTWGSGYIYRPLTLGAQVSVIAGTKYVGGHSDLMLGAVVTNDEQVARKLNRTQYAMGYSISADDAWLALRGVRTMPIRMAQHARHAMQVCEFFKSRPETVRLFHPAWPQDPGHALWQRDCTGSNGMLSVELRLSPAAARVFVDSLTLFGIGFSWGGFESLVQLVSGKDLAKHRYWGEGDNALVRLHIGLESPGTTSSPIWPRRSTRPWPPRAERPGKAARASRAFSQAEKQNAPANRRGALRIGVRARQLRAIGIRRSTSFRAPS